MCLRRLQPNIITYLYAAMLPSTPHFPHLPDPAVASVFFVTLRLADALPDSFVQNLHLQYYTLKQGLSSAAATEALRKRLFLRYERELNREHLGACYFEDMQLTERLIACLQDIDAVAGCCVLPNHLHLLLQLRQTAPETLAVETLEALRCDALTEVKQGLIQHLEKSLSGALPRPDSGAFVVKTTDNQAPGTTVWHPVGFDFRIYDADSLQRLLQYWSVETKAAPNRVWLKGAIQAANGE